MNPMQPAIDMVLAKLRDQEAQVAKTKNAVNALCDVAGMPLMFADVDGATTTTGQFRADQFYAQPLAAVVREILTARKAQGLSAASVNDLYDTMLSGGYKFDSA